MLTDLRLALRSLRQSPGFAAIAILTLAVGIGATTAMFGVLRALVVAPFSYPQADRIVQVWSNPYQPLSSPDFFDIRDQAASFAELGVYSPQLVNLGGETSQAISGVTATASVLRAFGVAPALGRSLEDADEPTGAEPVAVISHALWQRTLAGDPAVIGRTLRLNGTPHRVVGVMPAGFEFNSPWMRDKTCDVWLPLTLERAKGDRGSHWLATVGRLKPGVTVPAADTELKAIGSRLSKAYPASNLQKPFYLRSLHDEMIDGVAPRIWMLFGAVGLVLLVACANVASMLLARGARRQAEFGVRIALGANRLAIVRLALAESLLLAGAGTLLGWLLAFGSVRWLQAIAPATEARRAAMGLDLGILAFSVGLTLLATLFAGLPPALAAARSSVSRLLRDGGRSCAGSRARHRFLRGLVIAQIAIAFVLANGAALFSASYLKVRSANRSLATQSVISAAVSLQGAHYEKKETRDQLWTRLVEQVSGLPGATAVGATSKLPLEGGNNMWILVNDEVFDPAAKRTLAEVSSITPGYFAAMGIPLLRGRTLAAADRGEKETGIVVNRALAEKCWPGRDPLGMIVRPSSETPWCIGHVIGVVENTRQWGAEQEPQPEMYFTQERAWGRTLHLVVRATQDARTLTSSLRHALTQIDPDLSLAQVRTLQEVVDGATQNRRVLTGTIDIFMAIALGLVAVGLYGTLSYQVLQRTREFGIRMALGALRRDIAGLVLRQGASWMVAGLVVGVAGTLALTSMLRSLIWGVDTINPWSLAGAAVLLAGVTAIACLWPARRATSVPPLEALRAD